MARGYIIAATVGTLAATSMIGIAQATMGGAVMFSRLDTDKDGSVSRDEALAAAGRKFDLIASKNGGHVTTIALSGRVSKPDLDELHKDAARADADPSEVSRERYLALVDKAFTAANTKKKSDGSLANEALTSDELGSPAGKDLIDLLQ